MNRYLLDTSTIISYLRGKKDVVERIDALDGELYSSYFCFSELYEGVYRVQRKKEIEDKILSFFQAFGKTYGLDRETAKQFAKIRTELRKKGEPIEDIDIYIASTCLAHNLILVTENKKHFEGIVGLRIQ